MVRELAPSPVNVLVSGDFATVDELSKLGVRRIRLYLLRDAISHTNLLMRSLTNSSAAHLVALIEEVKAMGIPILGGLKMVARLQPRDRSLATSRGKGGSWRWTASDS